jgi:hypothetical protein
MTSRPLVVIPNALLMAYRDGSANEWMLEWKPTTKATMKDEIRAMNARHLERFVRQNVSIKKFLAWKIENPRTFITERVRTRITKKAA